MNYYNEFDPKTAAWLRELIKAGLIPPGDVDERSITEVRPHELTGYIQHHFFAGVGGWPYALRLAGWPDNRPVRTGSCPCQPFSVAGRGLGTEDERHLWPVFRDLITFGEPTITFGEQVASAAGRDWLAGVRADLEGLGYEVGGADLCAAGVGAPHPRQRLFWVANPNLPKRNKRTRGGQQSLRDKDRGTSEGCSINAGGMELSAGIGRRGARIQNGREGETTGASEAGRMGVTNGAGREQGRQGTSPAGYGSAAQSTGGDGARGMADSTGSELDGTIRHRDEAGSAGSSISGTVGRMEHAQGDGREQWGTEPSRWGVVSGCGWSDYDILPFRDGKFRRVEAGTFPLAHGVSGRVGLLRGYGNAIVPQVAAQFIQAAEEAIGGR